MWFKNIKLFQLNSGIKISDAVLEANLMQLAFRSCTAAMPQSIGWVPVIDQENAPLIHAAMGYKMICLKIEEKVLPATVVRDQAQERVREIEAMDDRKLSKREKSSIKDQIYFTLIQQAFCRSTKIYAYFDTHKNWLVVNCINAKKLELFTTHLKKAIENLDLVTPETRNIPKLMTSWLLSNQYPDSFMIEKSAVLEDFNDIKRVIRVKNQDLFDDALQTIIRGGCIPKQIALNWQDRISFNLNHDLTLAALKYDDVITSQGEEVETENDAQRFDADFLIMAETLQGLFSDVLKYIAVDVRNSNEKAGTMMV